MEELAEFLTGTIDYLKKKSDKSSNNQEITYLQGKIDMAEIILDRIKIKQTMKKLFPNDPE